MPSGSARSNPHAVRSAFLMRMGLGRQFLTLFDHLSDVDFFAKDTEGRFVAASAGLLRRLGFSREEEILGLTDADIHPARVVADIRADDLRVMQTRAPMIDRVEALFTRRNAKDWYLTTKLPVVDDDGNVLGVMGMVRPFRREGGVSPDAKQLEPAVAYIQTRHPERIAIPMLAQLAGLSERQLSRRFQKVFGMSAQEFIVRTRVQAASDDLLQSEKSVTEIAQDHGFYDQSAFTRQFRQHTGETPREFRRRHRRIADGGERVPAGTGRDGR